MPDELKLSMKQLAQMALGTPTLTDENIIILHCLIDLLLKKLNCTEETVAIGGFESKQLEELLQQAKTSTLQCDDEGIELIDKQLDRIVKLEERINIVSAKLEQHYEQIRQNANAVDTKFEPIYWEHLAHYCENLCTTYDQKDEIGCNLLKNADFLKKLLQLTKPLIDRIKEYEDKLETFYDKFTKFLKYSEGQYKKVALVGRVIYDIEELRDLIRLNHTQFEETVKEINMMLFAKLDKPFLPVIRKALARRFDEVENAIKTFERQVEIDKEKSHHKVQVDKDKCLSCGRYKTNKVCYDQMNQNEIVTEQKGIMKTAKKMETFCGCDGYLCMSRKRHELPMLNKADFTLTTNHSKQLMDASEQMMRKNVLFATAKQSMHEIKK